MWLVLVRPSLAVWKLSTSVLLWKRTDVAGLERLELTVEPDQVTADATVVAMDPDIQPINH